MRGPRRPLATLLLATLVASVPGASAAQLPEGSHPDVLWRDNDDLPIARPETDADGDATWWDGGRNATIYQINRLLDLGNSLHAVGEWLWLVGPREAANLNALDEVPDSSWFTNRHGLERLPDGLLERGPNAGPAPAAGEFTVLSGKTLGATPGFVMQDTSGARYLVKPDATEHPELATGAELVASKFVWAAGWNVPEYHLVLLDPGMLRLADDASTRDSYNRKRPMLREDLDAILSKAASDEQGRIRAVASLFIPGKPVGPPTYQGRRDDDANDTVDHQDRRELRGLRVVAAWLNLTDTRRGNALDTWIPDPGSKDRGHLVHYLLDFSSGFGAANVGFKPPTWGHEYYFDPSKVAKSLLAGGFWVKPWEHLPEPEFSELGYFHDIPFDPDGWRATYPNPLYDAATALDDFWGAKLVSSFTDDDIRLIVATGAWSNPAAEKALGDELIARRNVIEETYFASCKVNPADRFRVENDTLIFNDLAVTRAGLPEGRAAYRYALDGAASVPLERAAVPLDGRGSAVRVTLETSHDVPGHDDRRCFSPATVIEIRDGKIAAIHRR